jgi:hypothetical protein
MNAIKCLTGKIGFVLCSALLGALTGCVYAQRGPPGVYVPPPQVEPSVSVSLPGVEIRAESDFYEPLTPYGRWEVVGAYGRCWIPGRVEANWRPYSEGYWQRTDAGWYWASAEPWAWATYHYGRWDLSAQFGWYWVPQTQWAPAWVSWHSGGGYIGWAPLHPSARFAQGGSLEVDVRVISPRAYVFVEQRHFLEPVRRSTVVVNNTTIINKTVNITNTKVVNNTVMNEGPAAAVIEKESGRKVQAVPVRELRHKEEAAVVAKQRTPAATSEKKAQPPVRSEAQPREKKTVTARRPPQVEKPAAAAHGSVAPAPKKAQSEKQKPVPAAVKAPTEQKADKNAEKRVKPAKPSKKKVLPPAREEPSASKKTGPNTADKDHEKKGE